MQIVDRPQYLPHRCAVNPSITEDPRGFFWFGVNLVGIDPAIYVSVTSVETMARHIGCATADEKAELERELRERDDRIAQLETELNEASSTLEAIDLIESAGFRSRKKTGRPPKASNQKQERQAA